MALHFEVAGRLQRLGALETRLEPPLRFEAHHPWGAEAVEHRPAHWNPSAAVLPLQSLSFSATPLSSSLPRHARLKMNIVSTQPMTANVSTFFDPEFNAEAIRRHGAVLAAQHVQGSVPQVWAHAAGEGLETLDRASNAAALLGGSASGLLVFMGMKHYAKPSLISLARSIERFLLQDAPTICVRDTTMLFVSLQTKTSAAA